MRKPLQFAAFLLLIGCSSGPEFELAISNVSVIDVLTGDERPNSHLGIVAGRIAYLGSEPVPARRSISGSGRWAIPGLWDMHVHISDPAFFSLLLSNGIVGVRDMGGRAVTATDGCESVRMETVKTWRSRMLSEGVPVPEIVLAGPVLGGSGTATTLDASTPEKARQSVSTVASLGVDFVKVYEDIPLEALLALAAESRRRNLPFAGHVSEETLLVIDAIRAGQRSIEHVRSHLLVCFAESDRELQQLFESDGWDAEDRTWAARHVSSCPELWREIRKADVWLTPTLAVQETLITATDPGFENDPRRAALPESIRQAVASRSEDLRSRTARESAEIENWNGYIHRLVNRANREGAPILAGSDAACEGVIPGVGLHRELELLVAAGLSNLEALQAATLEPARYLKRDGRAGRLELGFDADLVLLDANPLEDIGNTRQIFEVIVDGVPALGRAGLNE